jgi:hypothetical protein
MLIGAAVWKLDIVAAKKDKGETRTTGDEHECELSVIQSSVPETSVPLMIMGTGGARVVPNPFGY